MAENGIETLDNQWEMLLKRASKEVEKLSDGQVVVFLTAKGTIDSIQDVNSAIEAENMMKFLIEKKSKDVNVPMFKKAIESKGDSMIVIDDDEIRDFVKIQKVHGSIFLTKNIRL